jgi:poly(3-hydroxybutyrate) depolymerase
VGMVPRNVKIDGLQRQWQEFVPSKTKEDPAYKTPLVVVFHGGGNAAKPYLNYLQWFKVAEERHFMVVLPQAYPNKSATSIATPSWNATGSATQPNDSNFVREMVKDIKSRHNIDLGRIYATGMSNGSMMTINVAMTLSDVFTACGSTSGVILTGLKSPMFTMPGVITRFDIPLWIIMGENDIGGGLYEKNNDAKVTIEYFQERNQTKGMDDALSYKNGITNHFVYVNAAGIPMVRYSVVDGKGHATMPSETWMLWDEFFCKYFRTDKGEILYQGNQWILETGLTLSVARTTSSERHSPAPHGGPRPRASNRESPSGKDSGLLHTVAVQVPDEAEVLDELDASVRTAAGHNRLTLPHPLSEQNRTLFDSRKGQAGDLFRHWRSPLDALRGRGNRNQREQNSPAMQHVPPHASYLQMLMHRMRLQLTQSRALKWLGFLPQAGRGIDA